MKRVEVTPEIVAALGTTTDQNLADRFRVSHATVALWRNERGIPPYRRHTRYKGEPREPATLRKLPQTPRGGKLDGYLDRLGTVPDETIAVEAGCSKQRVHQVREALGIAPCPKDQHIQARARAEAVQAVATFASSVLGTKADAAIAYELDVPVRAVRESRRAAGAPRFHPRRGTGKLTPELLALLGKVKDREIAERAGCTPGAVWTARRERGIPPYPERYSERRRR